MSGISTVSNAIEPFYVDIPQSALDDLKLRLSLTRWPVRETVADWTQGVPLTKAQALVNYWSTKYDWHRFQDQINKLPHFRTKIDGLGIHFIHVKSKHADALPLLLTHGWPGSFVEFLRVIAPLTDPTAFGHKAEDAFHVVIPSLPGYGFSDKPTETGWNTLRIAKAWIVLMERLGYKKWVAQGGDWGADITTILGEIHPPSLIGIHLNWAFVFPEKMPEQLSHEEQRAVDASKKFLTEESGYFREHSTRPQTIGYALSDSPVALATWIYEKFYAWTDNKGNPEDALSLDDMLDNITLYWLTNTGPSSVRLYWERNALAPLGFAGPKLDLPVAASVFPKELYASPKSWAEQKFSNLIYWKEHDKGGHFACFEQPELFTNDLRESFRTLRHA
jgi:pimeloyl-ACP methyl ester carboxylesterase